ncbi:MAG: 4-(cytidine 5'-diphospho)-2-C-methyl-D-erythritol kinase [Eubacteriales bacterium]|nr:4-(cytidine 5'-diphospho)-2-C-methyl-D-erythritol kinase [Eubacteriales bacterium]
MQTITQNAAAKINLSLDVVGKRPDGYHLLSTVMQSISLSDRVYIEFDKLGNGLILLADQAHIPLDERNTAHRAARRFLDAAGLSAGVRIFLEKHIPDAAGLAGGSSDAAAVLTGLSKLTGHPLSVAQLHEITTSIGADVPFCYQGGTVLCEGIGEIMTPLVAFEQTPMILIKPDFGISTPWAFSQLNLENLGPRPDYDRLYAAMTTHNLVAMDAATANVLETVALPAYPVLDDLKARLKTLGAGFSRMSGSGPTVFGLFDTVALRDAAYQALTAELPKTYQVISCETA